MFPNTLGHKRLIRLDFKKYEKKLRTQGQNLASVKDIDGFIPDKKFFFSC
jgi:hypothetical protein